ncbi:MAG: type 4a pilus biogenesis protein PilO [Deltaproteobacteria bacterium]|nr:type 4a pilus biogenesis protein PilO [Deltaproteobacteria bacterium]
MADINFDFLHSYSPLKKALLLLLITATIAGLFTYFIYIPKIKEIEKVERKLKQAQVKLHQTQQIANQLPEFEAEIQKLNIAFKKALNKLPDNKEIPDLLLTITKLGKDAKLAFNLFQPLANRSRDFYAEVPIDIEVQGSYHAVGKFFSQICAMPRIVNIFGYNLGGYETVDGEDSLKTKFQAVTYTFIDAPPVKKDIPQKGKKR